MSQIFHLGLGFDFINVEIVFEIFTKSYPFIFFKIKTIG